MANESGHAVGRSFTDRDGKVNSFGSQVAIYLVDGAITITEGTAILSKATAGAYTLAAPVATEDDGKSLRIMSITAAAHVVTQTTPGINNLGASGDLATFGAAVGNCIELVAHQGIWYKMNTPVGVTLG